MIDKLLSTLEFGLMLAGVVSAHIVAAWAVEPHQPAERVAHVARAVTK